MTACDPRGGGSDSPSDPLEHARNRLRRLKPRSCSRYEASQPTKSLRSLRPTISVAKPGFSPHRFRPMPGRHGNPRNPPANLGPNRKRRAAGKPRILFPCPRVIYLPPARQVALHC